MRIPAPLAWLVLGLTFLTCGLLRHHHYFVLSSPHFPHAVASLLFAVALFLFLVSIREKNLGASPGPGIRLGSLTPVLLMLLVEKWISISFYPPLSRLLIPPGASDAEVDARYRTLAGVGLLLACVLLAFFSGPTRRRVGDQLRTSRWVVGLLSAIAAIGGAYVMLWAIAGALGAGLRFSIPKVASALPWILGGQALRALAEEIYYRGLLQSEMERLAPRLGASRPTARRCVALLPTSLLFAMEHLGAGLPEGEVVRQAAFTLSLGLLLGILVMLTRNLVLAACVHTWINWLLLGAAPMLSDSSGAPAIPSGTYIGVAVALVFVVAFFLQPRAVQKVAG